MSLSLTISSGCSINTGAKPLPAEVKVVTKIERATPPEALTQSCEAVANETLQVTRDLVYSRNAWKNAFCACAASKARLVQWNIDKEPEVPKVCIAKKD